MTKSEARARAKKRLIVFLVLVVLGMSAARKRAGIGGLLPFFACSRMGVVA